MSIIAFTWSVVSLKPAFAYHLDEYDARIRTEANLPTEWFSCRNTKDCDLVAVPCQSDLAIHSAHVEEARECLIDAYPFCLGWMQDTKASCEVDQCMAKGVKTVD
jgi:hypothetical protein